MQCGDSLCGSAAFRAQRLGLSDSGFILRGCASDVARRHSLKINSGAGEAEPHRTEGGQAAAPRLETISGLEFSHMFCPQCGTESGSGLQYCRLCGANLKVIGKALTLSEAIARSDRGPLPKLKEMVKSLKLEHVTEEVSGALERMNKEILRTPQSMKLAQSWSPHSWMPRKKTPEERRENHIIKGTISLFSGVGLMIFLYYLSAALVLKLPPNVLAEIPFELDPVVRVLWLVGLIPALSGAGRIFAGLLIRPARSVNSDRDLPEQVETISPQKAGDTPFSPRGGVASVTDHTTHLLEPPEGEASR